MDQDLLQYILHKEWAYAHGAPDVAVDFKTTPADFKVTEIFHPEDDPEGEHLLFYIEKTRVNTLVAARLLAKALKVKVQDIGFCGMKDKHAVTRQWFSVYAPSIKLTPDPQWLSETMMHRFASDGKVVALQVSRTRKKIRRGDHKANRFDITLRNIRSSHQEVTRSQSAAGAASGYAEAKEKLFERLTLLKSTGAPNYFGDQRFGRERQNLVLANDWFIQGIRPRRKDEQGFALSAARSAIFNACLSDRIDRDVWDKMLSGEPEIYPTGPLWGRGRSLAIDELAEFEQATLSFFEPWLTQLEHQGLRQERRLSRIKLDDLQIHSDDEHIGLSFSLPPGQYATSVMRELAVVHEPVRDVTEAPA